MVRILGFLYAYNELHGAIEEFAEATKFLLSIWDLSLSNLDRDIDCSN
jgi:hypothetical protein